MIRDDKKTNSEFSTWYSLSRFSRFSFYKPLLILPILLSGCGGTGQDDGSVSSFNQQFSGLAVDGYLARATVFIDTDNNGTRDPWEPWAFTDNDGYYSYNPLTLTDYCAATATEQERQYCLVTNVEYSNVVIRIDSGYDVLTGEPFIGQMSRRVNAQEESVSDSVISPLTSLFANVEDASERETLLTSLEIDESDLDVDYLNADGSGEVNASLLNTALKIHKVVTVLSDRLTDTYEEIGESYGTPNDASSTVYNEMAQALLGSTETMDNALENTSVLVSILDGAEENLRDIYSDIDETPPTDMGSATESGGFERVAEVASSIPNLIDTLLDGTDTELTLEEAVGGARALETLVIKTVNEEETDDSSIDNVIAFFEDSTKTDLVEALVQSLSQDSADMSSLTENDFSGEDFDSVEEVSGAANLGEDASAFTQVGGLQIRVSDLDLGSAPASLDDAELEFYFNGEANDIDGSFQACIKYVDDANVNGTLGDGNTQGELVSGFWSLLGASEGDVTSYSLLITITFLGTTYQTIMKPYGTETVEGVEYNKLRFDYDGEINVWHSEEGFTATTTIPSTNSECAARLPSRHPAEYGL
ncbi:MAG: hypothetical protein KUG82_11370 [Pseudomonadales bacterium]|nr:hypothetical protein [Pseudomonadales bacterium]